VTAAAPLPSGGSGAGRLSNGGMRYAQGDLDSGAYLAYRDVITFGLQSRTVSDIGEGVVSSHCISASSYANGFLRKRYKLPLASWGLDLVEQLAIIVGYRCLSGVRGFNPEGGAGNKEYQARYNEALQWLKDVRDLKIDPDVIEGVPVTFTPRAESDPRLGW